MELSRTGPFDVGIVGGGPAGLSAALLLGRCRRTVVLVDDGRPRNGVSRAVHGFFSRDGDAPEELLRVGREQLARYEVTLVNDRVVDARSLHRGFLLTLASGEQLLCRKLLLATGLEDHLPPLDGAAELYGRSLFHCPFCDAWEVRDQPLAAYGRDDRVASYALTLRQWSREIVVCTDGAYLGASCMRQLRQNAIPVRAEPILRLEGNPVLERIVFAAGPVLERRAIFFNTASLQRSALAARLGCEFTPEGHVKTSPRGATRVSGVYAAGDTSQDLNFVSVAVAEGTRAAFEINRELAAAPREPASPTAQCR
jgi:thioredoxin reductase